MDASAIVVGAGPAGLTLAAELRLGGANVILIDKLTAPSGESRGLGFTARTMELFNLRGLLPKFGIIETRALGHFAGIPLDYSILPGAHFGARGLHQARVEAVLADWAAGLGVRARRGWTATRLADRGDHVDLDVDTPSGRRQLRCRYVIGCDGGRSTIRKAASFDFPGTEASIEMFLADVAGCGLRARRIGERRPGGMVMSAPVGEGVDRIIVVERGTQPRQRAAPPSFAEVAGAWQRLTGEYIGDGKPLWISAFTDATRQVTQYRRGSVLLAGDAAHIHLPAGGQGLSVSVQDAMNLGWKLAATITGWAPDDLLDSYHTERHPAGVRLLMNTQAQGYLYQSGAEVEPLRAVFAELMDHPEVGRHLAGMVSGFDIRYDMGPGAHPLLGMRLPNETLSTASGKIAVAELFHRARGVLLDLTGQPALRQAAQAWSDRVDMVTAIPRELPAGSPFAGVAALLARPDGYVAWAQPTSRAQDPLAGWVPALDLDAFATALHRWFGNPSFALPSVPNEAGMPSEPKERSDAQHADCSQDGSGIKRRRRTGLS